MLPDKKAFIKAGDMVINLINQATVIEFVTKLAALCKAENHAVEVDIFNSSATTYKGDNEGSEKATHIILFVNNKSLLGHVVANKEKKLEVYYS